jgi:dipeptidyl aminopeptidase/acylaminoacyl peptidase
LQGDNDQSVPVARTRQWVAKMKELGMEHVYVEVKGGDHSLFVSQNRETLSKVFSFFNIVRKRTP